MANTNRILIIVTSIGEYEEVGFRTGLWLGELTHFYDVVERAGFTSVIASIDGGYVPIDPESLSHDFLAELGTAKRYADREFMNLLTSTKSVAEVDATDFDAIYLTGGHGVMYDFPQSDRLAELIREFHESGKVVSAVCHGPCGLLSAKLSNGEYLIHGKNVTGFSWPEEELAQRERAVPYSLQDELKKRGAAYTVADKPFETYVVEDENLITGQNPGSAGAVADAVVKQLS
ncbi:type 1 glutamine amidotransferase domain-containing protein [Saccharopolyspora erythraea]|uniref:type 1 glutamine amidotransferase domain-containing protein n=1 Tax=Saccharopolyspora erythraea TaxID=1836 RepID=UPI001BA7C5BC|nr:type 1 glutamine amidotransferase domain-containing protein [Saccharopolyspora erythraea]QUH01850.1 type 1 glutamine amidotransferase domain-containing protein [Saccharopolyspora erythraea]